MENRLKYRRSCSLSNETKTFEILKIPEASEHEDPRTLQDFGDLGLRNLDIPSNYQYLFTTNHTKVEVVRLSGYFIPAFSVFIYSHEMNRSI